MYIGEFQFSQRQTNVKFRCMHFHYSERRTTLSESSRKKLFGYQTYTYFVVCTLKENVLGRGSHDLFSTFTSKTVINRT